MKKLALVFGMFALFMIVGCGNDKDKQSVQEQCGNVEFDKCVKYYVERCTNSDYLSCNISASLFYENKDFANSIAGYDISCKEINDSITITHKHIKGDDKNIKWETTKNNMSLKRIKREACSMVGQAFEHGDGVEQNKRKATSYYKIACDLGEDNACNNLGVFLEKGIGGMPKDSFKASKYYKTACQLKHPNACHNLGVLYYEGNGVKRNYEYAEFYFGKACDLGYSPACRSKIAAISKGKGMYR